MTSMDPMDGSDISFLEYKSGCGSLTLRLVTVSVLLPKLNWDKLSRKYLPCLEIVRARIPGHRMLIEK